jgi:hypothetical protein
MTVEPETATNHPTNSTPQIAVTWNDTTILQYVSQQFPDKDTHLPNPEAVQRLLAKHDMPIPSPMAVYQWTSRRVIPDKWRSILIYTLMRESRIDLTKCFKRTKW